MHLFVEPAAGAAPVLRFIREAKDYLYINAYYVADFERAIAADVRRGVKVRVMIDRHPWGISRTLVRREVRSLRRTGATVINAPYRFDHAYHYDHAKYMVSANGALIGTANFDHTAFSRNREYEATTTAAEAVRTLTRVFRADMRGKRARISCHHLAASGLTLTPGPAACSGMTRLRSLITAPGRVDIETEEIPVDSPALRWIDEKGGKAHIVIPPPDDRSEREALSQMRANGVAVHILPKHPIYMHAKMILSSRGAWIGSNNLSPTSLRHNREVGLLIRQPHSRSSLARTFARDFRDGRAGAPGTASSDSLLKRTINRIRRSLQ